MESVGTKKSRLGFEAPAPHIVVVCPTCRTSFAVETAAVAALEVPRFHCSRCDDIFVLKDSEFDARPGPMLSQSLSRSNPSAQPRLSTSPKHASAVKPSDFSISPPTSSAQPHASPLAAPTSAEQIPPQSIKSAPLSAAEPFAVQSQESTLRSELSLLSKGFLDGDEAPVATSAPLDVTPVTHFEIADEPSHSALETSLNVESAPSPRNFVLSDPTPPQAPKSAPEPRTTVASTSVASTAAYRPPPPPKRSEPLQPDMAAIATQGARFSPRNQGLISMSLPILGSMLSLLVFSYCARVSPQSIDTLVQFAIPSFAKSSAIHLPPSTLQVKQIAFNFEKTRSKDVVGIVTGSITNSGGRAVQGVELEALGFNERGEIVMSSRAPLKSALLNEKISDLSLETVKRYQGSLNARDSSIAAQETVPFTIALVDSKGSDDEESGELEVDLSEVKYFSARIFSVR